MCAKSLDRGATRMTATVDTAVDVTNRLVTRESRGPGDLDNAMRRIEQRYGVDYWLLWSLRYRKPKDILLGQWNALLGAYHAECERQEKRLQHERETAEAMGASKALLGAADRVAGKSF